MADGCMVLTNNPLAAERLQGREGVEVVSLDASYEGVLQAVRDKVHEGHELLSHPLSGSVKPNETPYKSVMVSARAKGMDAGSLAIIEEAIHACGKFQFRSDKYREDALADFRLVDWSLLESALESAGIR